MRPDRVVSGGQTGVDQAALRAALACGLATGGWCPPGRVCEAGVIPAGFGLVETPRDASPAAPAVPRSERTEWNVRDSDATLVLRPQGLVPDPGTAWTLRCAARLGRPLLELDPGAVGTPGRVRAWLDARAGTTLNVAGPSEGRVPGIGALCEALLTDLFARGR